MIGAAWFGRAHVLKKLTARGPALLPTAIAPPGAPTTYPAVPATQVVYAVPYDGKGGGGGSE